MYLKFACFSFTETLVEYMNKVLVIIRALKMQKVKIFTDSGPLRKYNKPIRRFLFFV